MRDDGDRPLGSDEPEPEIDSHGDGAVEPGETGAEAVEFGGRPERRSHPWRILAWTLVSTVVLAVAGAAGVALWLNSSVERIEDPFAGLTDRPAAPVPTQASDEQDASPAVAMNFLVLGSDSRISAGDPADWEAGAQRTDTIMLVHLPADGHDAWVMSIPRDSWVPIPGYGEAKINAAYSLGGPTLLIQTIEDLTGVRIDHFAIADFESFEQLTDALGGVEIVLGEDLYSRQGDLMESAGVKVLDGEEALVWARERYSLSRGDFDRVQRQQAWIRAILAKVSDEGILENPVRTVGFLDTVSHAVAVDDGLTTDVMLGLVDQVRSLKKSDVHFLTVPTSGTGRSPDGRQSIVNIDWVAFDALMAAVVADDVDGYLDEHSDDVDQLGPVAP